MLFRSVAFVPGVTPGKWSRLWAERMRREPLELRPLDGDAALGALHDGTVDMALVHHTVSANDYGPGDSAAMILAICRYHRNSNGWNDIGYNALVDKYGTIYEGRAGGLDQAIVGAPLSGSFQRIRLANAVSSAVDTGTSWWVPMSAMPVECEL